jgi:hypothetical protein
MNNGHDKTPIADRIRKALASPITSDSFVEPHSELKQILAAVGLEPSACGGSVAFQGKDPIIRSPWPLATMAGVGLMAKAVAIADVWKYRTGAPQAVSLLRSKMGVAERICAVLSQRPHESFLPHEHVSDSRCAPHTTAEHLSQG